MPSSFSFDERLKHLNQYEAEHGHMIVPYKFPGLGNLGFWVNNMKHNRKKGSLKADVIAKLDEIGFVWNSPKGEAKDRLIEWGKHFKWLVNFQKTKGHCNVPLKIAGKAVPTGAWCDEQRGLFLDGKLDQGKVDKLAKIGFDFYGSSDANEEPVSVDCVDGGILVVCPLITLFGTLLFLHRL